MTTEIITFGCRLNAFESEIMRDHARAAGLENAVIVNTCAVTGEAERQARQTIRRLRREHPDARIIVTGCAAQLNPGAYAAMPEVDRVLGNIAKLRPENFAPNLSGTMFIDDVMAAPDTALPRIGGFTGRSRAFSQVQQGCDHRCTFCVIPFARGPSHSVPPERILAQVRELVTNGYSEIVLTGVDLTAYGEDLSDPLPLGRLVMRILKQVPELERLRLSSLDPVEIDAALFDAVASQPRLMPHIHLSLQAGDDLVLKRMLRRHRRDDGIRLCERLRAARPGIALGADIIAGFPTETEAMFENSLALVEACGLTHLHVFPYSPRPDTPAARMPQISGDVVRARATRLRAAGSAAMGRFLAQQVGTVARVLVESPGFGHCEHYLPVRFDAGAQMPGEIVTLRITEATVDDMRGDILP
ncbi:MAG: tRNA (N(6)-L-threonylcarbamoyladenosine(37)-C(2))-methylthiotransferase MtaB [Alphaproteobacteria bacterium]|nr:tRNA (N(6)-L-threonylcarbamoyladenosine(37)-C(2))-methylthiotransferase MtaB [Alphaproteobacteria bacterium]